MGKWFPRIYDPAMRPFERFHFKKIRKELIGKAEGRVLEIGSGTGLNFPFYHQISQVDAVEPNALMVEKSMKRKHAALVPIHIHQVEAGKLPFADDTFDSVIATLVFCTIPDPVQALREVERVSKHEARILFFEHVRMDQEMLGKTQDVLTPFWKKICDGCHLNRDTLELVRQANMSIQHVDFYDKGLFLTIEALNDK
ncbi:class I SAM-dependent methyltransferase [Lentibacillus sp. Marseille-P4043]|uniref:class I SAM-dependent methyltransferase n=1 Tax=Lentibacillus sp. Marseille-P4043 TaxID=2040293 RepID=UPI000D0B796A|nr:class I SAM-dependent methyltransferase [Lentibacillus sp. Marseille-P4043]